MFNGLQILILVTGMWAHMVSLSLILQRDRNFGIWFGFACGKIVFISGFM